MSAARFDQPVDGPQQRAFAAPRWTYDYDKLTAGNFQRRGCDGIAIRAGIAYGNLFEANGAPARGSVQRVWSFKNADATSVESCLRTSTA